MGDRTRYEQTGPLRGVNLGGWLVLERWVTPSLFEGYAAVDEWSLVHTRNREVIRRIERHQQTFITEKDFAWLAEQGIEAVRLPVGYWVFGDVWPFRGSIQYVDRVMEWAERYGLKVLLDLHGAPGSQNGYDHSGRSGAVGWHQDEQHIIRSLRVLQRLARRYNGRRGLLGIELLNEPKDIPRRRLLPFYESAYRMIRAENGNNTWVVFSDGFRARRWKQKLRGPQYRHIFMDTHHYQTFSKKDRKLKAQAHLIRARKHLPKQLDKMLKYHAVIVGEWSLTLDAASLRGLDEQGIHEFNRAFAAAQLTAFEKTSAWFFWSYKTEAQGAWNFRYCVEQGWLGPSVWN